MANLPLKKLANPKHYFQINTIMEVTSNFKLYRLIHKTKPPVTRFSQENYQLSTHTFCNRIQLLNCAKNYFPNRKTNSSTVSSSQMGCTHLFKIGLVVDSSLLSGKNQELMTNISDFPYCFSFIFRSYINQFLCIDIVYYADRRLLLLLRILTLISSHLDIVWLR